ncbi:MAG: response regulator transcription factor [Verrucomicrobiales bacterium]|nr:response regulator transcription factor [Verrucomicrobiales bacterium]
MTRHDTEATVFIIDDDASVRRSLSRLVREGGHAVETFGSAEDFLTALPTLGARPACALIDLQMPGLGGLELQEILMARACPCSIVFMSGNGSIEATVQAMRGGAITFLTKPIHDEDLLAAIAEGLDHHRRRLSASLQAEDIRRRIATLSDRERETMAWVITGALNKQIADRLDIAERTVKAHRSRVMEKMGVASVAELVRLCDAAGFSEAV